MMTLKEIEILIEKSYNYYNRNYSNGQRCILGRWKADIIERDEKIKLFKETIGEFFLNESIIERKPLLSAFNQIFGEEK